MDPPKETEEVCTDPEDYAEFARRGRGPLLEHLIENTRYTPGEVRDILSFYGFAWHGGASERYIFEQRGEEWDGVVLEH